MTNVLEFAGAYWPYIVALVVPAVGTAIHAYLRRPKPSPAAIGRYFTDAKLLSPPLARPAYSDRMAYVLAEMSDLAYYQFEGPGDVVNDAVARVLALESKTDATIRELLDRFAADVVSTRRLSLTSLTTVLHNSRFALLDVINVGDTQGFVCKRIAHDEPPYLVLAFRGTEKKVSDWLTDARCAPTVAGPARVHTGFLEAFTRHTDDTGRTVQQVVEEILGRPDAQADGRPLPLFITGHSLGGALALLATRLVAPNVNGACYTFGAPRVGNYEYFRGLKTPVYRVVNSSDVVPRVPPGAIMSVLTGVAKGLSWLTGFLPAVSSVCDRIEASLDTLNGYRHVGDVRYLSDVGEGRFTDVRLLSNPPAIDRVVWMWRHVAKSMFVPLESHSMHIYRRKLAYLANARNAAPSD